MKILKLRRYMSARAEFEGVEWKMPNKFMQDKFNAGCREFFGVRVDEAGDLIRDQQKPEFFKRYHAN